MFSRLISAASQTLASQCEVCRAWPSISICPDCLARFARPVARCATCALPVPEGVRQCGQCIKTPPPLDACLAGVAYAYPWSDLISGFKFHRHCGRAASFARLLRSAPAVASALEAAHWLVPMPLSGQRLKERGFNQSLLLARALARHKSEHGLLLRVKDTPPQSSLTRAQRLASLLDAFAVDPLRAAEVKGARLVLVDDVMTSGASLFEAARALRSAGAAHITGLVIARTEF